MEKAEGHGGIQSSGFAVIEFGHQMGCWERCEASGALGIWPGQGGLDSGENKT